MKKGSSKSVELSINTNLDGLVECVVVNNDGNVYKYLKA